jgi:xanthine dehydrogenase accessory factor
MKLSDLNTLNAARKAGKSALFYSDVENGAQTLTVEGEGSGEIELTAALLDAAAKARNEDRGRLVEIDGRRIFIQVFNPPRRLIVVGAVHIAQPLIPMARLAGYDVTVIDPRGAWATPERFPDIEIDSRWPDEALEALKPDVRTAIVTLTHDPKLDDPALTIALRSKAFYIGALGSRKTAGKRVARLTEAGFGPADFARIRGPIGLDIGAVSPAEIAVSIVGQITETLHRPERAAV